MESTLSLYIIYNTRARLQSGSHDHLCSLPTSTLVPGNLVQMRAEWSLLRLCRVQPRFNEVKALLLVTEGNAPGPQIVPATDAAWMAVPTRTCSFLSTRIGTDCSLDGKIRSKSLFLSPGLRPHSLLVMLIHASQLACITLPISLACPADRQERNKTKKQPLGCTK